MHNFIAISFRSETWPTLEARSRKLGFAAVIAALLLYANLIATCARAQTTVPLPVAAAPACTGVQMAPGLTADSMQAIVDSHPAGTVFCFASGTYVLNHYVMLKDANQFICPVRRTCIVTGLDQFRGAFAAQYATTRHVIRGFVVERFVTAPNTWPVAALQVRDQGIIEDNET